MAFRTRPALARLRAWRLGSILKCDFAAASAGTMAVELSLVAPVLLLVMLGVFEVSQIIDSQLTLQNAARAGTNQALIRPPVQGDVSDIVTAVRRTLPAAWRASQGEAAAQIIATLECQCTNGAAISCGAACAFGLSKQTYVSVRVARPHTLHFQSLALPGSVELSASSIVRLQ